MSVWESLIGQQSLVPRFQQAAQAARSLRKDTNDIDLRAMSHAWLLTGPPGSGRSNVALALAAALQCSDPEAPGCGKCRDCLSVRDRSHPDVTVVTTQRVIISIDEVAQLVNTAQQAPSQGKWRIIVVEDADRMVARTANLLLKSIEEPPPRTVWVLCAPQPGDVLQTIRSRCRQVSLLTPSVKEVADLLIQQDGLDPAVARRAAIVSQCHVGLARALAADPDKLVQRRRWIEMAIGVQRVSDIVRVADKLVKQAEEKAKIENEELSQNEREALLRALGVENANRIPTAIRPQIKALEEDQKRRLTRSIRDGLDRILLDLLAVCRDIYLQQIGIGEGAVESMINVDLAEKIIALAETTTPAQTDSKIKAIHQARARIAANVRPVLAFEALLVSFRSV